MATGTASGSQNLAREGQGNDRIIDQRLNHTRRQVKLVELSASLLTLLVGVIGYLLVASIIDHWLLTLGTTGRLALLAVLLAGAAYFIWRRIVPLLVRSINPEYAARAIEESSPTLKNSLLNFLLLRRSPTGVRGVVMEAIERRAATDIVAVPVDTAVDRSKLIRVGYVLVGMLVAIGLYKVLSPKDPFQSAARVLTPWADISRPSRVQITEVLPGNASVYLGETVVVSAMIDGVRAGDSVTLYYTTVDGRTTDQPVEMHAVAGDLKYEGRLPAEVQGRLSTSGGLQQDVTYRIEAGDAVSADYRLQVTAAPRVVVEKVDYQYPAYTRKAPQSLDSGDLKAIEGTLVTIHARGNQAMKAAWVDFDPQPGAAAAETISLQVNGDRAHGSFRLKLKADRSMPWRTAYQVRFINEQQQTSQHPILHSIEVLRDLAPEVEILLPKAKRVEVPENGRQTIEVRAIDPDFGLSQVTIFGRARGKEAPLTELLVPQEGQPPQVVKRYDFRPQQFKLKAGEEVEFWAVARDNRTGIAREGQLPTPEPNTAKSESYLIKIVPAKPKVPGKEGDNDSAGDGDPSANADAADGENQAQQGGAGGNRPGDDQASQDPQDNSQGEGGSEGQQSQTGDQGSGKQSDGSGKQQQNQGEGQEGQGQQGGSGSEGSDSQEGSQQGGSQRSGENGGQQGGSQSGQQAGESGSSDQSSGGKQGQQGSGGQEGAENGEEPLNPSGAQSGKKPSGGQTGGGEAGESDAADGSESGGAQNGPQQRGKASGSSGNQAAADGDVSEGAGQGNQPSSGKSTGKGSKGRGKDGERHDGEVFEDLLNDLQKEQNEASPNDPASPTPSGGAAERTDKAPGDQPRAGDDVEVTGEPKGRQGQPKSTKNKHPSGAGDSQPNTDRAAAEGASESPMGGEQPGGAKAPKQPTGGKSTKGQGGQAGQKSQQPEGGKTSPMSQQSGSGAETAEGDQPRPEQSLGNGEQQQRPDQGGEGGRPQGAARTDDGKSKPKEGNEQPKGAGSGKTGDAGAGTQSNDKTGSGEGQEENRDRQKQEQDGSGKAESGETSAPSGSKRQSNSKGGQSGDRSGGGKQGAGQTGGQEGHDTAGGHSAGDEGAGAAQEQGDGDTGSKAGKGPQAGGKTGTAGNEKGEGSSSREGQGTEQGGAGPQPSQDRGEQSAQGSEQQGQSAAADQSGSDAQQQPSLGAAGSQGSGGAGPIVGGGVQGDRSGVTDGVEGPATEADQANLEFARKATDLVLSKLKDQEHNPDPELLDRMGMTREQMQEFVRRWESLKSQAESDPQAARELSEALRSLGLRDPKAKKRAGGAASDNQRDLRDAGSRTAPPSKYRDQFDAFRKGAARGAK